MEHRGSGGWDMGGQGKKCLQDRKSCSRNKKSMWTLWVRQGAQMTGRSYTPSLHRHELETCTKNEGPEAGGHYKPEWKADRLEAEQSFGAGRGQDFLYWNYPYLHTCMHIKYAVPAPFTWTSLPTLASSHLQPEPHQPWLTFFHLCIGML